MVYIHEGLALLGVDLHEVGNLLALTNFLVQLHNTNQEAPKRHITNLGGTTLQKLIGSAMTMNSLLLCFKMIDSSTHNHSLIDLAWWKRLDWWKATWGG